MKAPGPQLLCRSHNPFRPSLILWQHFVSPHTPVRFYKGEPLVEPPTTSLPDSSEPGRPSPVSNNDASTGTGTSRSGETDKVVEIRPRMKAPNVHTSILYAMNSLRYSRDYRGVPIIPKTLQKKNPSDRGPDESRELPYLTDLTEAERSMGGMNRLSLEMSKFYEWAKPTYYELRAREMVKQQLRSVLREQGDPVGLDVFGSERNGLALALSDIDFRVLHPDQESYDPNSSRPPGREVRRRTERLLRKLRGFFSTNDTGFTGAVIHFSRYPLLSLYHPASTLDVQLVCCNDTSAAQAAIAKYIQEYPQLPQVYALVRSMLKARELGETFHGGFGAYPTVMMIVAALRHRPVEGTDPADSFWTFLTFWTYFDTSQGLSIEPPVLFDKVAEPVMPDVTRLEMLDGKRQPLPPWMLCLRDPVDPTNDLGRKAASIKHFQATCTYVLGRLRHLLKHRGEQLKMPLLWYVLARPSEEVLSRRRKLEAFGRGVEGRADGEAYTAQGPRGGEGEGEGDTPVAESKPLIQKFMIDEVATWPSRVWLQDQERMRRGG